MHHYNVCGLRNVYLLNGYTAIQTNGGPCVTVADLYGLHHCIALWIVEHEPAITGSKLKFLRKQLAMTQARLGSLIGCAKQSVTAWETRRRDEPIPTPADRLIRLLYQDYANRNVKVRATIDHLSTLERGETRQRLTFVDTEAGWRVTAA